MDGMGSIAKAIIAVGAIIIVFGLVILLFSRISGGRGNPLPGDIVIHRRNITIYFPIISSIVISILLTVLFWVISAFRR